ncbi:MAG: helix-hairpin-helix domain-containing protein [Phycisphaerales bacterium]|nr:MAG: helix-hairpin-helix domain-containing protein [Phycisphaerales bacterium]
MSNEETAHSSYAVDGRRTHPYVVAIVLLALIGIWAGARSLDQFDAQTPLPQIDSTIDVNRAPWWELTLLPGIGEGKAKALVEFREVQRVNNGWDEDKPVFRSPEDLQQVHGIGPKTVERMAPFVRFDSP